MSATRVYILAKKLGVKSTSIVKKCHDEGLDVKNHMSAISAGLTATIEEWFTEGENITTIETTDKVDLKKVRLKAKRKQPSKKKEAEKEEKEEETTEPKAQAGTVDVPKAGPDLSMLKSAPSAIAEKPRRRKPPKTKKKPEPILPAGPMLEKPEPAKLSGPTVIRVEAPEPLRKPKPRAASRYNEPLTEPLVSDKRKLKDAISPAGKSGITIRKQPVKQRKERTHGRRRQDEVSTKAEKRAKFSTEQRQRDLEERRARLSAAGGEGVRLRPMRTIATKKSRLTIEAVRPSKAQVTEPITAKVLSAALAVKTSDIIRKLMQQGIMATANQVISSEAAELVALEFATELTIEHKTTIEEQIRSEFNDRLRKNLKKRPPIVTMLGHVDHGKTSLLDKIRSTQVTAGEAGGITQHIGAYQVNIGDRKIAFLDTPGHEAFTAMRARGANMTDVVVLVVAADDGVMPQTIEAINHANAANVPTIVALNKIDLPDSDINRVYSQLTEYDLSPAEWGGQTEVVKTSAITGEGIEDLLDHLDYIAELQDLKADDTIAATGWVVEAKLSPTQGPVATLLVKEGRLKKGDVILAGNTYGRVKTLKDDRGRTIKAAISSMPVEITGLSDVPRAGDCFYSLADFNRAKAAAEENKILSREKTLAKRTRVTLDNLFSQIEAGNIKELNVIIRADVQGSVDVLTKYVSELSIDEVKINILQAAPGGITEGDVILAEASNAIIIGFNVVGEDRVTRIAEENGVEIRLYNIIYRITEDLQKSMVGLLEPEEKEQSIGRAVVRTLFKVSKVGTIAGCYVSDGLVRKNAKIRLIRDNIVIRDDLTIESLKHFKDDARDVKAGLECGIKIAKFDDVKVDDTLDFYEIVKVARTI